ncbi:MAG: hypothetical protein GVY22_13185 [Gammaproteobacteria bacterium]|jgi:hypothetical protein|nr:hypothetical protein [Gammaproteobacteria bacterium]
MNSQAVIAIATVLLLGWQASQAADQQGRFNVLGLGTHSCGEFVEAANPDEEASRPWTDYNLYTAYTSGYLTGYNEFVEGTLDIRGQKKMLEIMAKIQAFCAEHPDQDFHTGLIEVVAELEPYRKRGLDGGL